MREYFWAVAALLCVPIVVTCGSSDAKRVVPRERIGMGGMGGAPETGVAGEPGGTPLAGRTGNGGGGAAGDAETAGAGGGEGVGGEGSGGGEGGAAGASAEGGAAGRSSGEGGSSAGASREAGGGEAGGAGGAHAAESFQDAFDGEPLATNGEYTVNYAAFEQWNVIAGSVDILVLPNEYIDSPGGYGVGQPANAVVVDLNGSNNQAGAIETKRELELTAGVSYTLRYSLGNARPESNGVAVSIPGLVARTHTYPTTTAFTSYQETFTPVTTVVARLRFTSEGNADQDGVLVDNVSIVAN